MVENFVVTRQQTFQDNSNQFAWMTQPLFDSVNVSGYEKIDLTLYIVTAGPTPAFANVGAAVSIITASQCESEFGWTTLALFPNYKTASSYALSGIRNHQKYIRWNLVNGQGLISFWISGRGYY